MDLTLGFPEFSQELTVGRDANLDAALARFRAIVEQPESPVRAHEPVLDPMGGTELNVLPIWRTAPAAAHRAQIPDPYEGQLPLMTSVADEDVAAGAVGQPGKVMLRMEEVPATQAVK
jgi:hypothetical protein